ncbi:MAG: hypothetical protein DYG89_40000 [Caldilinea sp. CFX5]|nr:hypothetical protein [Caldilinea sp. CFX5]
MVYKTGKRILQVTHAIMRRYWIFILVLAFGLLSIYTSHPIYGAPMAQSTPDVNTVPKPLSTPTPENTPFPTPTPVSDNAPDDAGEDESVTAPEDNSQETDNADNAGVTTTSADGAAATEQSAPNGVTGAVTAVTLNLRKGPNTTARVIDTLFLNDPVAILGRNQSGDWLYICCGARTNLAGWVSKQFIATNLSSDQAMTLIPLFESVLSQTAAAAPTAQPSSKLGADALVLEMRPQPSSAWQGQTLAIQFVVRNRSDQALTAVQLRNDLPDELAVVHVEIGNQGQVQYRGARQRGPLITMDWPTVPANGQLTATVTVQIAPTVADGVLIDNLAVVTTQQGAEALAGITLAMPPVALPQFR